MILKKHLIKNIAVLFSAAAIFSVANPQTSYAMMGQNNGNQNELNQDELNRRLLKAFPINNVTEFQNLINQGADVNIKTADNIPILIRAICYGFTNIVNILLAHDADVNATDNHGQTALMSASYFGNTDIVNTLLAHGADVTARDSEYRTAFLVALFNGHYITANVLRHAEEALKEAKKQNNANQQISAADQDGIAFLFKAADTGNREFFAAACWYSSGDIIKHKNRKGQNALMVAAIRGCTNIGSLILSRFAYFNINEQDNDGRTALMLAVINKEREFAELLFNRSCEYYLDIEALKIKDNEGKDVNAYVRERNFHDFFDWLNHPRRVAMQ